jgi:hypothetical protein
MSVSRVAIDSASQKSAAHQRRVTTLFIFFFTALALLFIYTFLHEAGHAISALVFGGSITGFSIAFWDLSAHVGLEGNFGNMQKSIIDVSGTLLPVLVWSTFMMLVPKRVNPLMQWLKLVSSFGIFGSLLPWVVIPLLANRPEGDDVTKFLSHSSMSPWLVSGLFLLLILGGCTLLLIKMPNLCEVVLSFRHDLTPLTPEAKRTLGIVAVIVGVIAAAAFSLNAYGSRTVPIPAGYTNVGTLELSAQTLQNTEVHSFTLSAPAQVSYHITLRNVRMGPAEILLSGTDGFAVAIMRAGEQFEANHASYTPTYTLTPGTYRLELTFRQAPGQIMVAWRAEAMER